MFFGALILTILECGNANAHDTKVRFSTCTEQMSKRGVGG